MNIDYLNKILSCTHLAVKTLQLNRREKYWYYLLQNLFSPFCCVFQQLPFIEGILHNMALLSLMLLIRMTV